MRSRINSVQPVLIMRVTEAIKGDSNDYSYTQSFEWGRANVEGKKETQESLKNATDPNFIDLETLISVKIDKTLTRDMDLKEFKTTPILLYIPSTDTVENRFDYTEDDPRFFSGWWRATQSSPSFRQYKGGGYTEATAQALYYFDNADTVAYPAYSALKQYYESGKDPLVEHPNPNVVASIENAVGNLDFVVGE